MSDMDDKDRKPPAGWRHFANAEFPPDMVIADGWVVPRPATREDVHAAVQQGTADVRQQIQDLRARQPAAPATEPSPTHVVVVGSGAPPLLDVKGCAALLGISVRSWQRLVENGKAPKPVKLGKSSRWRRSDVEAFVASRR